LSILSFLPANYDRFDFYLRANLWSRVLRGKFAAGQKRLFTQHQLQFHGSQQYLIARGCLNSFLRQLFRQDWVVYSKPQFGGAEHVLNYLARYTHRVAISNHASWILKTAASHFAGETMHTAAGTRS